ncbi:uncharacterized protein LOC120046944 isoform X2 [Salvelinus namaycush]|uniref:Uncharacterized protein LOC120046944 isoform X2 n=1 Tax=Salvelinus namaycush TaxID=8040 RepID=A0A8U0UD73_SALNM|nr:uncharacterized protein LOC120046944 isoform X2 [Salvelinus namaycush]
MASLRENYHVKVAQVDALHSLCDSMEHKYSTAANEMEVLRQSLGNARSDSSLLHRESELVVTNVNQWVKEQNHLQKSVEGLQEEMKRLKAELEESRIEAEKFRASQASMSGQRSALTRLPVQLLHTDICEPVYPGGLKRHKRAQINDASGIAEEPVVYTKLADAVNKKLNRDWDIVEGLPK